MMKKIVLLLAFFVFASSAVKYRRTCSDPVPNSTLAQRKRPTACVNYKNIVGLDEVQTTIKATQLNLVERTEEAEERLDESQVKFESTKRELERRIHALENLETKFSNLERQLREQKTEVEQQKADIGRLKNENAGITQKLRSAESKLQTQGNEQERQKTEVDRLNKEVNPKVAFSATIIEAPGVFTGPSPPGVSKTLIFNKVFTNIASAYDSTTGIFTVPVKGVYHFTFMTFGYNTHTSGAILAKNGHYQVSTWEFKGPDASDTTSNTVILNLNVGERISVILWQGGKVHTSVFSGFLVFPIL
uniref:uncharacterized protein n=1 Tax=Centroberyx gerrardi TaxID=166262 RepID=UPI003AB009EB